nr:DUF2931 family protein [Aeromonas caviae]
MSWRHHGIKVRDERCEVRRDNIGLGMATGGYVEAFLTNPLASLISSWPRGLRRKLKTSHDKENPFYKIYKRMVCRF